MSMMNKGKPLPGEDAPFAQDFRLALAQLTGTDQTGNKSMWQSWWNKNKKGFKVSADATNLPLELTLDKAGIVFGLTLVMCAIAGLLAMRKVRSADPAEVF